MPCFAMLFQNIIMFW